MSIPPLFLAVALQLFPALPMREDAAPAAAPAPAPAAKSSTLEYIDIESNALKRPISVGVYLPPGYHDADNAERYPVLYFLHGLFGSERKWEQRGTARNVDALLASGQIAPMIVVCPNGENSFYMKWADGTEDWESFVVKDLVEAIDARYRTHAERSKRGLSGDSMGGFGALNLGFRNPAVFGSISAHSAALLPEDPGETPEWMKRFGKRVRQIFGDPPDAELWKANNPIHLARTADPKVLNSLAIYFDCGADDRYGFDSGANLLHEALKSRGIGHDYHLRNGNHGADYFIRHVDHSLLFHAQVFAAPHPEPGKTRRAGGPDAGSDSRN